MVSNKHASATGSAVRRAAGGGRGPGTAGQGPFAALGRVVVHHPWLTILAWVVAAAIVSLLIEQWTTASHFFVDEPATFTRNTISSHPACLRVIDTP